MLILYLNNSVGKRVSRNQIWSRRINTDMWKVAGGTISDKMRVVYRKYKGRYKAYIKEYIWRER